LDTSGFGEWSAFEQVLHYTDLILFDLKQMDREKHIAYTGVDSKIIIENLKKADQTDIPIYIRYPVIPGYTDDEKSILDAARLIKSLKHVVQTEFLPYHTLGIPKYQMLNKSYELEDILPQNEEQIKRLNKVFLSAE
jgi:pyruvate formate lyase activating enzyme